MATDDRRASHPLVRTLLREGHTFSFFQATRLLQQLYPEAPRVGEQGPPRDEIVRFVGTLDLNFPSADITKISQEWVKPQVLARFDNDDDDDDDDDDDHDDHETEEALGDPTTRFKMATTFLGLYGTSSPIPTSYTEDLLYQEPDCVERGFYDLFQHRLTSLLYRAWERYRYTMRFSPTGEDYYSRRLSSMLHLQEGNLPAEHRTPMLHLLGFAGLLTQEPSSAATLEAVLSCLLPKVEATVESFVGRMVEIPEDQQLRLGQRNHRLGEDAHLGRRILDRSSTFRVRVEADDFAHYVRLLPGGDLLERLREAIDLFNSDYLDYQIEVRLSVREKAASSPLGASSTLLGWSTWLGAPAPTERYVRILYRGALHGRR